MTDNLNVVISSSWESRQRFTYTEDTKNGLYGRASAWLNDNLPGINFWMKAKTEWRDTPSGVTEYRNVYCYTFCDEYDAIQFKLAMA